MLQQSAQQIIIDSLMKERAVASARLKDIDRVLKQVKDGDFSALAQPDLLAASDGNIIAAQVKNVENTEQRPLRGDTKLAILKIMDDIGKACKLKHIQTEYDKLTGANINIREGLRALNKIKKVKLMKEKTGERGIYWVKSEWVLDGRLLDEYRPESFDLLYSDENLEYT